MEMDRIPEAGYDIVGLDVYGIERRKIWKNVKVLYGFLKSYLEARKIVRRFAPDAAIGVGGYVSAAAMRAAASFAVPVILQEQNSFAGITNKFLARRAKKICVAYDGMERFFDKSKIVFTGNPVRQNILSRDFEIDEAYRYFHLDPSKKTLLIVGGSLGARTINDSIMAHIKELRQSDIQVIWQTGKYYFSNIKEYIQGLYPSVTDGNPLYFDNIFVSDFISKMDYAYAIADAVISRAGASSISELCLLGKPSILVPSPNVSENHQYHNAMSLANKNAAIVVEDHNAKQTLVEQAVSLIADDKLLAELSCNIKQLAANDSAQAIATVILEEARKKR